MSFFGTYVESDRTEQESAKRLLWFESVVAPKLIAVTKDQGYDIELLVVGSVKSGNAAPDSDIDVQVRHLGLVANEKSVFGIVTRAMGELIKQSDEYERYHINFVPNDRGPLLTVIELFRRDQTARHR